jgi:hypothetical protein
MLQNGKSGTFLQFEKMVWFDDIHFLEFGTLQF